jgi:hypothetical protein
MLCILRRKSRQPVEAHLQRPVAASYPDRGCVWRRWRPSRVPIRVEGGAPVPTCVGCDATALSTVRRGGSSGGAWPAFMGRLIMREQVLASRPGSARPARYLIVCPESPVSPPERLPPWPNAPLLCSNRHASRLASRSTRGPSVAAPAMIAYGQPRPPSLLAKNALLIGTGTNMPADIRFAPLLLERPAERRRTVVDPTPRPLAVRARLAPIRSSLFLTPKPEHPVNG